MKKRFPLLFALVFAGSLHAQVLPDSLLGTWVLDSLVAPNALITQQQAGELGTMRILSNGLLIIRGEDNIPQFHTFRYEAKQLYFIEEKQSVKIQRFSKDWLVILTRNEGVEVRSVYKKGK